MTEETTTSNATRRRWPWVITALTVPLGWIIYMLALHVFATARLPDGSSLTFLQVIEPKDSDPISENLLNRHSFQLKPKKTAWDSVWKRLPSSLQRHFRTPPSQRGTSLNFSCPSSQALWFEVSPTFSAQRWRFFWVDDQGYETETWPFSFNHSALGSTRTDTPWIAFEGRVPRGQKHLHLLIRTRVNETEHQPWERLVDGKLGEVVAELKIPNKLEQSRASLSLTPQTLPATVPCRNHTITLNRVVRTRVASQLTGGLRFELLLDGHEAIDNRYSLYEWFVEDTKGNIAYWPQSTPHRGASEVGTALWNDSPVWKARFRAVRNLDRDYSPEEKVTFQRIPLPPPRGKKILAEPWESELVLQGHKVRVHDVASDGPTDVTFQVTVSPRMQEHALTMLRIADEQKIGSEPVSDTESSSRPSMEISGLFTGVDHNDIVYRVQLRRPTVGDHMAVTFGMDKGVPLEFTFRPEFEP